MCNRTQSKQILCIRGHLLRRRTRGKSTLGTNGVTPHLRSLNNGTLRSISSYAHTLWETSDGLSAWMLHLISIRCGVRFVFCGGAWQTPLLVRLTTAGALTRGGLPTWHLYLFLRWHASYSLRETFQYNPGWGLIWKILTTRRACKVIYSAYEDKDLEYHNAVRSNPVFWKMWGGCCVREYERTTSARDNRMEFSYCCITTAVNHLVFSCLSITAQCCYIAFMCWYALQEPDTLKEIGSSSDIKIYRSIQIMQIFIGDE